MGAEILLITILLGIFAIILGIICAFLSLQIKRSEKLARPFLTSLLLYFLLLCIANIQQVIHNILNYDNLVPPSVTVTFYTTFFVFVLTLAAPIYLIFHIEKIFFPDSRLAAKYHLITLLNVVLFIAFVVNVGILAISDITVITDFDFMKFRFLGGGLLFIQVLFVIFAFLYLGIKSSGRYRTYALLVSIGWLMNYAANALATFLSLSSTVILILFIPKLLGVILTSWGLYRLYALRSE